MQPRQLNRSRIRALIAEAEQALAQGPHPERARLDAEEILLYIFRRIDPGRNRAWLYAHASDPTSSDARLEFKVLLERRLRGEPIQYITGEAEFYGLPFRVTPAVLIPRPETELLLEKVLGLAAELPHLGGNLRIADVGAGSGAIAVVLARHLPHAEVTATDLSEAALAVARENAEINGVSARIRFLNGDLLAPVAAEQFDCIVSNPPYVPESDRASLSVEVRDHEPAIALFAGDDGLAVYRRLIPAAFAALAPGGLLALEIGCGQSDAVATLLADVGFAQIGFTPDLQNIPRVATARRP
jgi:release factor glutamine methyltransferase